MSSMSLKKNGVLWFAVLCSIALFGFFGLRAGEDLSSNPPLNVAEVNKDANGNIKVHEQGTVAVTGTVNVGNNPSVQDVRVTNAVEVKAGVTRIFFEEVYPFDKDSDFELDISKFSRLRILGVVNVSGTVHFSYETNAGVSGSFDASAGGDGTHTELLGEVAGT
jgi:hypothetical protein